MMQVFKIGLIGFLIILSLNVDGRDAFAHHVFPWPQYPITYNTSGLLLETSFSNKLSNVFKCDLNLQARYMDDFTELTGLMPEFGLSARINKYFSLKSCYRYNLVWGRGSSRILIAGYFKLKKKNFPLRFQYRSRLETGGGDFWRNRVKTEFNLTKIMDPYSSFEIFYMLSKLAKNEVLGNFRFESGLKWKVKKTIDLNTMYRFEKFSDSRHISNYHVIGVSLDVSLN